MKLLLVRHGQTEWNQLQKYQGQTDIPLDDTGRMEAKRAGVYIKDTQEIEAIYCSDLSRTRETAAIIAGMLGLTVQYDSRLRELGFGTWEGKLYSDIRELYPDEYAAWYNDVLNFQVEGSEPVSQVIKRAAAAIRDISLKHSGTVVCVTHGGLIKILLNNYFGAYDLQKKLIKPGSITSLKIVGGQIDKLLEMAMVP